MRLTVHVEVEFDIAVYASLESGEVEGPELPLVVAAGQPCAASYLGSGEGIVGSLVIEGFRDNIPFQVRPGAGRLPADCFVCRPGAQRESVVQRLHGGAAALPSAAAVPGAVAVVAELRLLEGSPCSLAVTIRRVQELEARRLEARREAAP